MKNITIDNNFYKHLKTFSHANKYYGIIGGLMILFFIPVIISFGFLFTEYEFASTILNFSNLLVQICNLTLIRYRSKRDAFCDDVKRIIRLGMNKHSSNLSYYDIKLVPKNICISYDLSGNVPVPKLNKGYYTLADKNLKESLIIRCYKQNKDVVVELMDIIEDYEVLKSELTEYKEWLEVCNHKAVNERHLDELYDKIEHKDDEIYETQKDVKSLILARKYEED